MDGIQGIHFFFSARETGRIPRDTGGTLAEPRAFDCSAISDVRAVSHQLILMRA